VDEFRDLEVTWATLDGGGGRKALLPLESAQLSTELCLEKVDRLSDMELWRDLL